MLENFSNAGIVIPNISLSSDKSISEAFAFLLDENRFDWFEYYNHTVRWTAKLVLFSGHFEGNWQQPPGYVRETGVTVGGTNIYPNQNSHVVLQPQIKCQATRVKCSALFVNNETGREYQLNHADQVAQPGLFWLGARFAAKEGSTLRGNDGSLEITFELIDSGFTKQSLTFKI